MTRAIAWGAVIFALHWALANPETVLRPAWSSLAWLVGPRLLDPLWTVLKFAIAIKVFIWFVGLFKPELASRMEPLGKLLPWLLKALGKVVVMTGRTLFVIVEGRATSSKRERAKGGGR